MKEKKVLLIVDPQQDFISGSLGVMGASSQLKDLADRINNDNPYDRVIITLDAHPVNHCSFIKNGGKWPGHCIKYTAGYLPDSHLWEVITRVFPPDRVVVVEKGKNPEREEYGALDDPYNKDIIHYNILGYSQIDIAGIMSEYCVLETVKGLSRLGKGIKESLRVLLPAIATMDNHKSLLEFCEEKNIKVLKNYENK